MQTVIRFRLSDGAEAVAPMGQVATARRNVRGPCGRRDQGAARADGMGARARDAFDALRGHAAHPRGRLPRAHRRRGRHAMSAIGLTLRQVRFTNKSLLAEPGVGVLHVRVPADVPGDLHGAARRRRRSRSNGDDLEQSTYYVVAMATFGVITACYTNIAISVCVQPRRGDPEAGAGHAAPGLGLPRRRASLHAMVVGAILVVITLALRRGLLRRPVARRGSALFEFLATFLVGVAVVLRARTRAHRDRSPTPTRRRRS